jgi:hypothetical protein
MSTYASKFSEYFEREVARKAAKSIADGAEVEIRVGLETLTFTKSGGQNQVLPQGAKDPQLVFTLSASAADAILAETSEDIGVIGVHIAKLIVNPPTADTKIGVKLKAGFLTLFSKGYFGVLTAGGAQFASFLASKGLNGMGAIKDALKKMKA